MKFRVEVVCEIDGVEIIDLKIARLLYYIDKYGSILSASRRLGIPYSRAWEYISRIERFLKVRIIDRKRGGRGGGGACLTDFGKELLNRYIKVYRDVTKRDIDFEDLEITIPDIVYMGSNDPIVEYVFGILRDRYSITTHIEWLGSGLGLASLSLGEADICGIHLLDPETGRYNISYIEKYWLEDKAILVRGYLRDIGFVCRRSLTYDEVIEGILRGELKLACRQRGTGSRTLLKYVLARECRRRGLDFNEVKSRIRGLDTEYRTHIDVVRAIVRGEADVGIAIRWAAEQYKLHYIHITWENFDFVIRLESINKDSIKKFIDVLKSRELLDIVDRFEGYKVTSDVGTLIKPV